MTSSCRVRLDVLLPREYDRQRWAYSTNWPSRYGAPTPGRASSFSAPLSSRSNYSLVTAPLRSTCGGHARSTSSPASPAWSASSISAADLDQSVPIKRCRQHRPAGRLHDRRRGS